ncbi:MAG: tetratricopeptide repeat protein [Chloroflexota bacterium]|nr:tetratricopeptide repeat protein [Chloroflexota bacterium]
MVKAVPQPKLTAADDLRDQIREAERIVVNLKGMGMEAVRLLKLLDEAQNLITVLETKGMDLRPERIRLTTVQNQLRSRAAVLVREVSAAGGLPTLRRDRAPDRDRWWWYLDESITQHRRRRLRNRAIVVVVILILFSAVAVAYDRFLAPDPSTQQKMTLISEATVLVSEGDFTIALEKYQAAHDLDPTDVEVLIWVGVLSQQLGQYEDAEEAFTAARSQLESEIGFLVTRGMVYGQAGQLDAAQADAEAALALDSNSAEAHFLMGNVYEVQGQNQKAIAELQQAADLARQANNDSLYVLAATKLTMLLQVSPLNLSGE